MKKIFFSMMAMLAYGSIQAEVEDKSNWSSIEKRAYCDGVPVININKINEAMLHAFMSGDIRNIIVELNEGTLLPFRTNLKGDLINIVPEERDPIYFQVMQTFYLKEESESLLFSTDLQEWRNFTDFVDGNIDLTIEPTPTGPMLRTDLSMDVVESSAEGT